MNEKLLKHRLTFYSQTNTKVIIKMVEKYNIGSIDSIAKTMVDVHKPYELELMFEGYPSGILVVYKDSLTILSYTRDVYNIGNAGIDKNTLDKAHFYNLTEFESSKVTIEI